MNWYYKQIIKESAMGDNSVEAFLARIGVPEETISYVTTITNPELKQQVIGYLRKFPQTPSALLMEKIRPQNQQPQQNPNTPQELQLANRFQNIEFQKWLLVSLRKARNEYQIKKKTDGMALTGDGYSIPGRGNVNFTLIPDIAQSIFDWYIRGVLPARQAFQAAQTPEEKAAVINEYGVTNANTNLAGLTLDQADQFAENWHDVISGEGEGLEYYGEKKEDVVFGPQWSRPDWAGWTIKKVVTKNNLKTEGGKVGHCVGSYCDDVMKGNTRIFSLRDPSNMPYVTMEVDPKSWTFRQIYGDGPKTGNTEPSKNLKAMIGEWMRTLKGATIEGMDDFDYSDLSYGELDDDLERAIYKGAEGYGLPVSLTKWEYQNAYKAVYNKLNNDRGYHNDGGYQTHLVSKVLARAAVDSDIQKLNQGLINEKKMKAIALNWAHKSAKHSVMKKEQFDRMSPENKKIYLKDYIPEAAAAVQRETEQALKDKWQGWERYTSPQAVEQKTIEKAYYNMSQAKEFDYSKLRSFDQLDEKNQKRFMAQVLDAQFQIAQIYEKRQENDENFFNYYDDSYLDFPDEPQEDDFEDPEEYQKAISDWESEKQQIEDEAADEYRNNNLPYCLDDSVVENVEKLFMQMQIRMPRWISKYFNKKQERINYPTILWVLENIARKKKEINKGKMKHKSNGWYALCKLSNNEFLPDESKREQSNIEIRSDFIDSHHGQSDVVVYAYDTQSKKLVGQLSYNIFNNQLHVEMIEVIPEYRRQGVGTLLMQNMIEENPGLKIKPGLMTNDGYPFYRALRHRRIV